MKSIFTSLIALLFVHTSWAQCTPDLTHTSPGIYPDSATNLPVGYVNLPYSVTITAVVPADTTVAILLPPIPITDITVGTVTCTPPLTGFAFNCNVNNCAFPGGQTNCGIITASPSMADTGTHILSVPLTVHSSGGAQLASYTLDYYKIKIEAQSSASVRNLAMDQAGVAFPNPYLIGSGQPATIEWLALRSSKAFIKAYSNTGNLVWQQELTFKEGKNIIQPDLEAFSPGIYQFCVSVDGSYKAFRWVIAR